MKKQKMSFDNMQGKLSRAEMKNVMAGQTLPVGCVEGFCPDGTWFKYCLTHGAIDPCWNHQAI